MNQKNQGISGFSFLLMMAGLLVVMFGTSLLLAPDAVKASLGSYLLEFVVEFAVKIAITFGLGMLLAWVVFFNVLDTPLEDLRRKFEESHNDSHAIMLGGILGACAIMLIGAGGQSLREYLFAVLMQGSLAMAVATIMTICVARLFGVRSMDQFRDWIQTEDNDSYAVIVVAIWLASLALAMM